MAITSGEVIQLLSNASATGEGKTVQLGGRYFFSATATWNAGSVSLEMIGPDGSTWIAVTGGSLTDNGQVVLDLPAGQYRAAVDTATGVYASLCRVTY